MNECCVHLPNDSPISCTEKGVFYFDRMKSISRSEPKRNSYSRTADCWTVNASDVRHRLYWNPSNCTHNAKDNIIIVDQFLGRTFNFSIFQLSVFIDRSTMQLKSICNSSMIRRCLDEFDPNFRWDSKELTTSFKYTNIMFSYINASRLSNLSRKMFAADDVFPNKYTMGVGINYKIFIHSFIHSAKNWTQKTRKKQKKN